MRKLLACFVALLLTAGAMAQNRSVTGKVTDAQGAPIPKITVSVKGSSEKTVTDETGSFKILVPPTAKQLTFSGVGYATRDAAIGSGVINLTLSQDVKNIDEVVVVGYQTRKKREEGGAVAQVKGKEIANLPNVSVDRALQGRAAGVLVQANNGIPGGAINVRIRGAASFLTGVQPLYIVDGVQFNNRVDGSFTQNNPLAFLNPNDIESIDILKDAASSAIYGAQAANGVVLITTKKGKGGKTKFVFNVSNGVTNALKKFDMLNSREYVNARAEADFNRYSPHSRLAGAPYPFLESQRWALGELSNATGLTYGAVTGGYNQSQVDSLLNALPNYDWQDANLQTGNTQNIDFSMSGGTDRTTFYISGNYTNQATVFKKVDFKRYGLNFDLTHKINEKLMFTSKLNLSTFNQSIPFATDGSALGSPAFSSPLILPVNRIKNVDGSYFGLLPSSALAGILNQNIVAVNDFNSGNQRTNQLVGSFSLDYKINKWLSYRGSMSLDYRLIQGRRYRDPRTNDGFAVQGRGTVESSWNTNLLTTHLLNFKTAVGKKGKLDGVVGYEYRSDIQNGINAEGLGFPSYQFTYLNSAATPNFVGEFYTGFKRVGLLSRINYSYDSRYSFSFIALRDGSSRFGANNKFGNFFGGIASWNIDNENFMKKLTWVSQARLRLSYGT
ncbi:MAG: SusC/RagA family TonB-linked outer membrane protein, partial [Ferruginibacter sp.]